MGDTKQKISRKKCSKKQSEEKLSLIKKILKSFKSGIKAHTTI